VFAQYITLLAEFIPQDAVDRVVLATVSNAGMPIDHVSIKCRPVAKPGRLQTIDDEDVQWQALPSSDAEFGALQEELRSAILKVGLLDTQLPKLPEGEICFAGHTMYRGMRYIVGTVFLCVQIAPGA